MATIDEQKREVNLDDQGGDAVLIVSADGQVMALEPPYEGPMPKHVQVVLGLANALSCEELHQETLDLIDKALGIQRATLQ